MKKLALAVLSGVMACSLCFIPAPAYALTDDYILNDQVQNTYTGRKDGSAAIENTRFTDINGHWAQEAVVRSGALNLVKGYGKQYNPEGAVTNAEAIAFALRVIGRENEAVALGAELQAQAPAGSTLRSVWSLGYITIASDLGLINADEYADAIQPGQEGVTFSRNAPATRERVADWLVLALRSANARAIPAGGTVQKILNYSDYDQISARYAASVEAVTVNKIMNGDGSGRFNPKGRITRAEMAQVLKNLDNSYYPYMNLEKKTGTIGTVIHNQYTTTGTAAVGHNIYVRTAAGTMDMLQYTLNQDAVAQQGTDAVVFKNGQPAGLDKVAEGDQIEYIVDNSTRNVLYVQVTGSLAKTSVEGYFHSIDIDSNSIQVRDSLNKYWVYSMMEGILTTESDNVNNKNTNNNTRNGNTSPNANKATTPGDTQPDLARNESTYVYIGEGKTEVKKVPISKIPGGSRLKLTLTNGVVTRIDYVGNPVVTREIRGIVIENNPDYGFMTILDNDGRQVTKYFYEDNLIVKKRQFYDLNNEIGYIDQVFDNFTYNPLDTVVSAIEPGDIVFLTLGSDGETVTAISAASDYVMKYGKIKQISNQVDYFSIMLEYEDKQTGWYDIAGDVFISEDGKPISMENVQVGDWAKLLVSQAVVGPGHVLESVKEIAIEGDEHFISGIIKGNLSGINSVQRQLMVQNAYALAKTGWTNYTGLTTFSLTGSDIEYYYNNQRISLDYAVRYFKRSDATVYLALENHYTGSRIKKVTFRTGRDEELAPDTVIYANGGGEFSILGHQGNIKADSGTIVRRYGRLVDAQDIMIPDYATVILNGAGQAAVVDITETPSNTRATIAARGRVLSVNEGKSFKVQSMSVLNGAEWLYTPVQREFAIDHNTRFLNADGYVDPSRFVGYTDESAVNKVYNIVVDGSRATHVVEAPYCTKSIKGTIYRIDGDDILLKDVYQYDNDTGKWRSISHENATAVLQIPVNGLLIKNNAVTPQRELQVGDQLSIMTDNLPAQLNTGGTVTGYIVFVNK